MKKYEVREIRLRPTKICLFTTAQAENDVRLYHREAKSLVRAGYDVVIVIPGSKSGQHEGISFYSLPRPKSRLKRMFVCPWMVMKKALRTQADIYHFHDPELLFQGWLLRWVFRKRVVFDMRESTKRQIMGKPYLPKFTRKLVSMLYALVENACLRGVEIIVANDQSVEDIGRPCFLVRNFPSIDWDIVDNPISIEERRKENLLVYIGGVWESRGAFKYIALVHRLLERGYDVRMKIIGPYEDDFGLIMNKKVCDLGLCDRIESTGRIDYTDAMQYCRRAIIGLSILDPIPNYTFCLSGKIVEYMMCGTPVLTSNFEPWLPYVEGEGVGLTVNPCDMEEIVSACARMLDSPEYLQEMSERGIRAVCEKYNWECEFVKLMECYEHLLGHKLRAISLAAHP